MLLLCAVAVAEDANNAPRADINATLLLGPGVVVLLKPYAGMHPTVYPYAVSLFIYDRFYISIDTVGYRLLANRGPSAGPGRTNWHFDLIGRWRSDGYDEDDSDELEGMHNRNKTFDVGGEFGVSGDWGSVTAAFLTDVLGVDDGQEIRVVYAKPFKKPFNVNSLKITPSVGLAWQSNNLVDYYYGVRSDEARAGRPAYSPDTAVNWLWGVDANYRLNDKWTLLGGFTYYWLDSEIRNSPIVSRDYSISIIAGAMYKF